MRRTSSWRNLRLMRLDDCYRLLDLPPGASGEEVKRAYRDPAKVWHPDRFSHDARLRQMAEEKLKGINELRRPFVRPGTAAAGASAGPVARSAWTISRPS